MLDDLPELLDPRPRRNRGAHASLGVGFIARDAGDDQHPRGEQHRQLLQLGGSRPFERFNRLDDLAGVPDLATERRVHAGDERLGPHPGRPADRDERLRPARARPPASS